MRLHPLRTGELLAPPGLLARADGRLAGLRALGIGVPRATWTWIPVPAFLVEHPARGPVLVDTGLPGLAATDTAAGVGRIGAGLYELRMQPEEGIGAQLRARGVDASAIRTVVMTHLHLDHAAGMSELANATFLADRREWAAADARTAIVNGYHRPHFAGRARRELDLASDGVAWEGFERTLDVFEDGSLRLLWTPGHTPGHLSVALALAGRRILLTGDLAYTAATVRGETLPGLASSYPTLKRSLAQLRAHLSAHPDTLVVPGHDAETWADLEAVYG